MPDLHATVRPASRFDRLRYALSKMRPRYRVRCALCESVFMFPRTSTVYGRPENVLTSCPLCEGDKWDASWTVRSLVPPRW